MFSQASVILFTGEGHPPPAQCMLGYVPALPPAATAVVGTHPTGMHSCSILHHYIQWSFPPKHSHKQVRQLYLIFTEINLDEHFLLHPAFFPDRFNTAAAVVDEILQQYCLC